MSSCVRDLEVLCGPALLASSTASLAFWYPRGHTSGGCSKEALDDGRCRGSRGDGCGVLVDEIVGSGRLEVEDEVYASRGVLSE